ncbi:hypothetical protein ACN27G_10800 [Plantactinospora sp. WMMB334]|uniref:hypothetical protein n=1 Tax=Plantactinospora sp. WMMB334 TaxID=3404119 RepID=UPI003B923C61
MRGDPRCGCALGSGAGHPASRSGLATAVEDLLVAMAGKLTEAGPSRLTAPPPFHEDRWKIAGTFQPGCYPA